MKSSTYYFHVKTKILADFQNCISLPLSKKFSFQNENVCKNVKERNSNSQKFILLLLLIIYCVNIQQFGNAWEYNCDMFDLPNSGA